MPPEPARHLLDPALWVRRRRLVRQPVLDVLGQCADRAVAVCRPVGHRLQANRLERRRNRPIEAPRRRKIARSHLRNRIRQLLFMKWRLPRYQLVKSCPQAVDVARWSQLVDQSPRLLRAHVRRSADRHPVLRSFGNRGVHVCRGRIEIAFARLPRVVRCAELLRQPPVDHQRLTIRAKHDVQRLQVAVQHPPAMGIVDRVADVQKPPDQLPELDPPLGPDRCGRIPVLLAGRLLLCLLRVFLLPVLCSGSLRVCVPE